MYLSFFFVFFFSSRRRHTRWNCDWSSDVCSSDLPVLLPPPWKRRQPQPPGDDPVHVLEQQHLGEQVLPGRVLLQLAHGLVPDLQQLLARERVLVLLDALQDELLVFLLERAGRAAGSGGRSGGGRAAGGEGRQHGSTWTVTSASCRSCLR